LARWGLLTIKASSRLNSQLEPRPKETAARANAVWIDLKMQYDFEDMNTDEMHNLLATEYSNYLNEQNSDNAEFNVGCLIFYGSCIAAGGSLDLCDLLYEICEDGLEPPNPNEF